MFANTALRVSEVDALRWGQLALIQVLSSLVVTLDAGITQLSLGGHVVQIWSRKTPKTSPNKPH